MVGVRVIDVAGLQSLVDVLLARGYTVIGPTVRGGAIVNAPVRGVVDLPRTRAAMADKPESFFVRPDDVADLAAYLAKQPRSAWTFEAEARPFAEKW